MVHIDNPVGLGAASAKHDVAVIQASLKNIKINNKPFWPGTIDGRKNKVLEEAIKAFQAFKRIRPTSKVERNSPTIKALNSAVPRALVDMRGVKGTCAVYVSPVGAREADREARAAKSNAPFPATESAGLATIITNVGRAFGICLERKREFVTQDGHFAVEMDFMQVRWIRNGNGILLPAGRESGAAVQAVCRLIQSVPAWAVGSSNDLVFKSTRQVPALKGIGPATPADLKALGLAQMPKHEVISAVVAACAKLLRSGDILNKGGRAEHRLLIDAVRGVDKSLAIRLETAVKTCAQLQNRLANLVIQEDEQSETINAASDALGVRSKELGIIADSLLGTVKLDFAEAFKDFEVATIARFGVKVVRSVAGAILSVASGVLTLNEIDRLLKGDTTANDLLIVLADNRKARHLTQEEMRAIINRQKELGCP